MVALENFPHLPSPLLIPMSTSHQQMETRQLHPLQVTSMVLYYLAPMTTESFSPFLVLRAWNLPHLGALLGKERRFFATVTDGERTWRSRPVRSVAQCAEWNEDVEAL
jgi:hypothetical protein